MAAAKAYRNALLAMSSATAALASALEACSRYVPGGSADDRVKGCRNANSGLAGSAGLQFMISNHEQLLADTVYRQFEIPLLEALDNYKMMTAERLSVYEKGLHEQSGRIRKTEAENLKGGRRRKRGTTLVAVLMRPPTIQTRPCGTPAAGGRAGCDEGCVSRRGAGRGGRGERRRGEPDDRSGTRSCQKSHLSFVVN
jgi:hypothetical protein